MSPSKCIGLPQVNYPPRTGVVHAAFDAPLRRRSRFWRRSQRRRKLEPDPRQPPRCWASDPTKNRQASPAKPCAPRKTGLKRGPRLRSRTTYRWREPPGLPPCDSSLGHFSQGVSAGTHRCGAGLRPAASASGGRSCPLAGQSTSSYTQRCHPRPFQQEPSASSASCRNSSEI
jgi:hypothetical protein